MSYVLKQMLFIHIARNGGHAIWNIMKAHGGRRLKDNPLDGKMYALHSTAEMLKTEMGGHYLMYDKVALVRDPWQRAVSLYHMGNPTKERSIDDFREWMTNLKVNLGRFNPFSCQTKLLGPEVLCFDLERIALLYNWMEINLEIQVVDPGIVDINRFPVVRATSYQKYYTPRLVEKIRQFNKEDINRFGWRFEWE